MQEEELQARFKALSELNFATADVVKAQASMILSLSSTVGNLTKMASGIYNILSHLVPNEGDNRERLRNIARELEEMGAQVASLSQEARDELNKQK